VGILLKYGRREMHLEFWWENHLRYQPHGRSNILGDNIKMELIKLGVDGRLVELVHVYVD
jgi:hypothetical protein